jgi:hypothetical protein
MTFFSGTVTEVIYSMPAAGTALNTSTAKTVISSSGSATLPAFQLPTPLWQPSYAVGRGLRINFGGTWGVTAAGSNFQFWIYLDTTQGTPGSVILASTGVLAIPAVAVTTGNFYGQVDIVATTQGLSSNVYTEGVFTNGFLAMGAGNNASTSLTPTAFTLIGSPSSALSYNPLATNYIEAYAQWGTSNADNTIQLTEFMVSGLN